MRSHDHFVVTFVQNMINHQRKRPTRYGVSRYTSRFRNSQFWSLVFIATCFIPLVLMGR